MSPCVFLLLIWYREVNKSGKMCTCIYVLLPVLPIVVSIWNGLGNTEGMNSPGRLLLYDLFGKLSILGAHYLILIPLSLTLVLEDWCRLDKDERVDPGINDLVFD